MNYDKTDYYRVLYGIIAFDDEWDRSDDEIVEDFQEKLQLALSKGYPIDYKHKVDDCPYSLLQEVVANGAAGSITDEIINVLLDNGADVNINDSQGRNVLTLLCSAHHQNFLDIDTATFQRIVDSTEDINERDKFGYNALEKLCDSYTQYSPIGFNPQSDETKEHIAALIKILINAGIDTRYRPLNGADYEDVEFLRDTIAQCKEQKQQLETSSPYTVFDYEI